MGIDKEVMRQVEQMLRPLGTRIANSIVRGVVKLVDDSKKLQLVQLSGPVGSTIDGAEHAQPYGFTSVPLAGADTAVVVFPNGDSSHPLVVAIPDRRYRPTGKQPGEVTVYNNTGASITLTKDGDIIARASPGRDVIIDDGSGTTEPVVKRSEFLGHGHATAATGPVSPPIVAPTSTPPAVFPGTTAFQAK